MSLGKRLRDLAHHARRIAAPRVRPAILLYHRVADAPFDPWGLAVSPRRFAEQCAWLAAKRTPLALDDFCRRMRDGTLPQSAVALTFDDGYADNLHAAKPALEAAGVPATVFLSTGYIGGSRPFWPDELAGLVLGDERRIEATISSLGLAVSLEAGEPERQGAPRPGNARSARQALLQRIQDLIRSLGRPERDAVLEDLRSLFAQSRWIGCHGRPMEASEVSTLVEGGLICVGPHTVDHPGLPGMGDADRTRQIVDSTRRCRELAGRMVDNFAYPFGHFDDASRAAVRDAGISFALGAHRGPATDRDPWGVPRVKVEDWSAQDLSRALRF
jgi:peptidoglycan/xylan/chitin deacetylase (PgdA/CDA1 family)